MPGQVVRPGTRQRRRQARSSTSQRWLSASQRQRCCGLPGPGPGLRRRPGARQTPGRACPFARRLPGFRLVRQVSACAAAVCRRRICCCLPGWLSTATSHFAIFFLLPFICPFLFFFIRRHPGACRIRSSDRPAFAFGHLCPCLDISSDICLVRHLVKSPGLALPSGLGLQAPPFARPSSQACRSRQLHAVCRQAALLPVPFARLGPLP